MVRIGGIEVEVDGLNKDTGIRGLMCGERSCEDMKFLK
jgi:hypothetical protein